MRMLKSSRGNPYHDARGRFCSAHSASSACCAGKMWAVDEYERAQNTEEFERMYSEYYSQRTEERFNSKPSAAQVEYTNRVCKQLGIKPQDNMTVYETSLFLEAHDADVKAHLSEAQQKAIYNLEQKTGIYCNGRHGGAYIGHAKAVATLREPWAKDGKKRTADHYTMESVKGHYICTETRSPVVGGKRTKITTVISSNKKKPAEVQAQCIRIERERFERKNKQPIVSKRSPATIEKMKAGHNRLKGIETGKSVSLYDDGKTKISATMAKDGDEYIVYRDKKTTQKVRADEYAHSRREVIGRGSTADEARTAAVKYNEGVIRRETNLNRASNAEMKRWAEKAKMSVTAFRKYYKGCLNNL